MSEYKTILEKNVKAEIVEKKSRFISNVFYVESVEEAEEKIKQVKKKYFDAKHNCYAYRILDKDMVTERFSDDGEPSGTAGAPMLDILAKTNLCNVVVVVTRYFGGILLGTGGLVRAYSDALKASIQSAMLANIKSGYEIKLKVTYSSFEKFKYYCKAKGINITESSYSDVVDCTIELCKEEFECLKNNIEKENEYNIISFDIVRQKTICEMSN